MRVSNESGYVNTAIPENSSPTLDRKAKKHPTYLDRASRYFIPFEQYRQICNGENPGAALLSIVSRYAGLYSGTSYGAEDFTCDRQILCKLAFDRFPAEVSLLEIMQAGRAQYSARVVELNHDLKPFGLEFVLWRKETGTDGRLHTFRRIRHCDEPLPEPRKETSGHVSRRAEVETFKPFQPLPEPRSREEIRRAQRAHLGLPAIADEVLPEQGGNLSLFAEPIGGAVFSDPDYYRQIAQSHRGRR